MADELKKRGFNGPAMDADKLVRRAGEDFTLHKPEQRAGKWVVALEDVLGERHEKVFSTQSKALDCYTELWLGISRTQKKAAELLDAGISSGLDAGDWAKKVRITPAPGNAQTRVSPNRKAPLSLRKVADVLGSYGLDPTVELAEILQPVMTVDPDTGIEVETHRLDAKERASLLIELLQYAHPKLKAVEMKVEGTIAGMTQEQIDARLQQLLVKAAGA